MMLNRSLIPPMRYRFEDFEFRERTGELWRSGLDLHLPDQAGKVLLALLRIPGEVVTREELRQALWPDKVCGDFEGGLHAAVRKLRRALDDAGAEPRLVGTLPRRGYRLLVPVVALEDRLEPVEADSADSTPAAVTPEADPPAGSGLQIAPLAKTGGARWLVLAGLLVITVGAAVLLWRSWTLQSKGMRTLLLPGKVKLDLVHIPAGEFAMGFDTGYKSAEVVHRVTLTQGFWMGMTEVTQAQWRAVMGNTPSYFQGEDKPVEQVSWDDCQAFLTRLNQLEQDLVCRMPTEAEWEYAARTIKQVGHYERPDEYVWHFDNSLGQTHPVSQKQPNPWGLFDMVGNVWEWCSDGYGPYSPYPQKDPQGPASELRTVRGGSCLTPANTKTLPRKIADRVTLRYGLAQDYAAKDLGLRIVAVPRTP